MRGSVLKKGDRWYVKIELDPDPVTGRRRQKWHSGFRTRRDAERARIDLLSKFDRGEYVEPSHQTVAEFFAEWLKTIEPTIRESTLESYARNVRLHVVRHIGTVRLTKVDAGVLNGLYAKLL
ncbi:MAG TPA: Arm DNA-binding domain-containing protein, partial [Acidimicrobiales bacterium]|nr:Arm DNA-binding domain-containing protein [Acidimicrobiales bacterium]